MMNYNRIVSYRSKNTLEDMTNPRLIGSHMREIIDDTIKDKLSSFQYPNLNLYISGLSKKGYPSLSNILRILRSHF